MRVLAMARAAAGQVAAARRRIEDALTALEGTDALELRCRVLVDAAEVELLSGAGSRSTTAIDRVVAAAAEKGSVLLERRLAILRERCADEPAAETAHPTGTKTA